MFADCLNLTHCYAFNEILPVATVNRIFANDANLIDTDFRLPARVDKSNAAFFNCSSLSGGVTKYLPYNGFLPSVNDITLVNTFRGCRNLTVETSDQIGKYLWNAANISFSAKDAFTNTSLELRNNIPQSWGGNASDDIIHTIFKLNGKDITEWIWTISEEMGIYP